MDYLEAGWLPFPEQTSADAAASMTMKGVSSTAHQGYSWHSGRADLKYSASVYYAFSLRKMSCAAPKWWNILSPGLESCLCDGLPITTHLGDVRARGTDARPHLLCLELGRAFRTGEILGTVWG